MIDHVLDLGNQLKKEFKTSTDFEVQPYKDLLIVGMGGSGVAGDVLKLVLNETTQINVEVRKTYGIPEVTAERNPKCLFISYSGNTEETLSVLNCAIEKGTKVFGLTTGGELADLLKKYQKIMRYIYQFFYRQLQIQHQVFYYSYQKKMSRFLICQLRMLQN